MDIYAVLALAVLIITVLAIIVVRKPKDYKYNNLDISGIIFNFVLGIIIYPPLCVVGQLLGIAEFATEPLQVFLEQAAIAMGSLMPAVCVAGIGASVILRRKGKRGKSFLAQFAGLAFFALTMALGLLSGSF